MAELLLLNPRRRARRAKPAAKRRTRRASSRRRNPVPAGLARYMARKGRRTISRAPRRARRSNPIARVVRSVRRRRRNPIALGGQARNMMAMIQAALVGGAGAVAVDVAMGQINRFLPATLQRTPGRIGVGDAVKAALTVVLGKLLAKPTRGLSVKMAQGALTVQAHQLIAGFVPAGMTLGYSVPGHVVQGTNRVGPIRQNVGAYTRKNVTPLLSAYTRPGATALLNGSVREREGVSQYR
jgi:hypothetical protein